MILCAQYAKINRSENKVSPLRCRDPYRRKKPPHERLILRRTKIWIWLTNPSSGRVMEKCGMQKEGVLRQRLYNKGRYVDVALYAILKQDYEKSKQHD